MSKVKVLLVDDELDFLEVLGVSVRAWGYDVLEASSGKEAIEALKNNPDIVILDCLMPEMDGVQTLREIRKISNKIPVVMFTAHPDGSAMADTEKLGVYAFIPKLSFYQDAQATLKSVINTIAKRLNKE